jgi:hypothetical protein
MTTHRLKLVALVIVLILGVSPAMAQGNTNTISANGFSFSFDSSWAANVNIVSYPGDPVDYEAPGGPEVKHTEFILYNGTPAPESQFDAVGGIRVYRTADFAGYEFPSQQLAQLQSLVASKADLTPYMAITENTTTNTLPMMPIFPAAQVIRARAQHLDLETIGGIGYLTVYRQDVSPFISSEFFYVFQGLSKDGQYYVSAMFKIAPAMFPTEIAADFDWNAFSANFSAYLQQSVDQLNAATPDQFMPSLAALDAVVGSLSF